jgi:HAD superfamily hydrolase (TIGR01509 family)
VVDLVIFDNDGVLVDSEPHANAILADLLTQAGLPITNEECVTQFMGGSLARVREAVEGRLGRRLPIDFEEHYHARLFERFQAGLAPVEDVSWALDRVGLPVCVASSGTQERIRLSLTVTGLIGYFEGRMFSVDDVQRGKPAPDLFLFAAEQLGVAPSACAVVEDSALGIAAANAAGMVSFGFARVGPIERLERATGGVFTSMRELPAMLQ